MKGSKSIVTILLSAACMSLNGRSGCVSAADALRIVADANLFSVYSGENPILRYRYDNVPYKPYAQQLFSPGGVNVLRDAPADHLHHHGLMFAVAVDGVNFWEEQQSPGCQLHHGFGQVRVRSSDGVPAASFEEEIDWMNPRNGQMLLKERRTIEIRRLEGPAVTILTWQAGFEPSPGSKSATLSGSAYFGLGMRFLQSMDTGGQFVNSEGKAGVDGTNDKRAKWCTYSALADGKVVTVAMFDHPDNERHPATWFTMENPFAYLSATLNLEKQPLSITSGKPFVVRYGVAILDGRTEASQISAIYERWIGKGK